MKSTTIKMEYPHYSNDDIKNIHKWFKDGSIIKFEFKIENISKFKNQIQEMESTLNEFPEDKFRIEHIFTLLQNEPIYAIFVDKNDNFILEGRHRIVAFSRRNQIEIPVYYVSVVD